MRCKLKKTSSELDTLLDRLKVANYRLVETDFHQASKAAATSSQTTADCDSSSLEQIRDLLRTRASCEAVILYTSGTSGLPKGVVLTCANLTATVETIRDAWQIDAATSLLHMLPLNHVHGLIYALLTTMYAGATVHMMPKFNAERAWTHLLAEEDASANGRRVNTMMAVPTIFVQMVNAYLNSAELRKAYPKEHVRSVFRDKMRLIVSGSAPLNVKTYGEWKDITGYDILERYGMTEIGLGLSNPFVESATSRRVAGTVGRPYGDTLVRIVAPHDQSDGADEESRHVVVESDPLNDRFADTTKTGSELFGELQIKGAMVFKVKLFFCVAIHLEKIDLNNVNVCHENVHRSI